MSFVEPIIIEQRLHTRHRCKTQVSVRVGKKSKMCIARNLSASGVLIDTGGMGLRPGNIVELSFAVTIQNVVKIHRRTARVAHVTKGLTGFVMEAYGGK